VIDRRTILSGMATICVAPWLRLAAADEVAKKEKPDMNTVAWPVSLAQWSLHRMLQAGELSAEDFPTFTRERFGITGVEYVNSFFKNRSTDDAWLSALDTRCKEAGVKSVLIMIDGEGALGDPDRSARSKAVENHYRWLHAAAALGCHGIRVNVPSKGTPEQQRDLCATGLSDLLERADAMNLNVMIENHGGLSSNGSWLSSLIALVDHPRLGSLPDFGNFILDWDTHEMYDRYQGVDELLPYAKALSAKSHDFDESGNETHTDYGRMFELVRKHGYTGWIGVEYEGDALPEVEGIERTRDLLITNGCVAG